MQVPAAHFFPSISLKRNIFRFLPRKSDNKNFTFFFGQQTSPHAIKHSNQVKIEARKNVEIIYCSDTFQNHIGTIEPLKCLKNVYVDFAHPTNR